MLKQDLKDGMILETRNGERYLLINGKMRNFSGLLFLNPYRDDLTYKAFIENDIVKVYEDKGIFKFISIFTTDNLELIWERKEIDITNGREVEVLKALKTLNYPYIARDRSGNLYAYENKPEKSAYGWCGVRNTYITYTELFKFIKWEDDEPTKIDNLLKGV